MRYGTAFAAIALFFVAATATAQAKPASLAFEAASGRILQDDDTLAPRYDDPVAEDRPGTGPAARPAAARDGANAADHPTNAPAPPDQAITNFRQ